MHSHNGVTCLTGGEATSAYGDSSEYPEQHSTEITLIFFDVTIIGAGPAGIAAAIAASNEGLRVVVIDHQQPPIDKPCGEGILPHGVAALRTLGITVDSASAIPFRGIRFVEGNVSTCAEFSGEIGLGMRRPRLHALLVERAMESGVRFLWGTRVTEIELSFVVAGGERIDHQWLVGADGQNSRIRQWMSLGPSADSRMRFTFRKHFQVRPWTDVVEVYWTSGCQVSVTPTGGEEVCVAVMSSSSTLRVEQALSMFPALASRLENARAVSRELGSTTALTRLGAVTRKRAALVGDASGTVDAITGHGLSLSFLQALSLAEAFKSGNLAHYEAAHRRILAIPIMMTRLMLFMDRNDRVRRRALRLFQDQPRLFSKLMSIHTGETSLSSIEAREVFDFGWKFLWA